MRGAAAAAAAEVAAEAATLWGRALQRRRIQPGRRPSPPSGSRPRRRRPPSLPLRSSGRPLWTTCCPTRCACVPVECARGCLCMCLWTHMLSDQVRVRASRVCKKLPVRVLVDARAVRPGCACVCLCARYACARAYAVARVCRCMRVQVGMRVQVAVLMHVLGLSSHHSSFFFPRSAPPGDRRHAAP